MADLALKLAQNIIKRVKSVKENKKLCMQLSITCHSVVEDLEHLDPSMRESPQAEKLLEALEAAKATIKSHKNSGRFKELVKLFGGVKKVKEKLNADRQVGDRNICERTRDSLVYVCVVYLGH